MGCGQAAGRAACLWMAFQLILKVSGQQKAGVGVVRSPGAAWPPRVHVLGLGGSRLAKLSCLCRWGWVPLPPFTGLRPTKPRPGGGDLAHNLQGSESSHMPGPGRELCVDRPVFPETQLSGGSSCHLASSHFPRTFHPL